MSPDKIEFPDWVPPDAQQTWTDICSVLNSAGNPLPEARDVLRRLATRLEMREAWEELKHFKPHSNLIMAAFSTWLCAIYNRIASLAPQHATLGRAERKRAIRARAIANEMRAVHPTIRAEEGITDVTLAELDRVAAFFERQAKFVGGLRKIAPPPYKRKSPKAEQYAFIYSLCDGYGRASRRRPYRLVAILANVVYNVRDAQWDEDRVKHLLRARSCKK
jgi:hypothetical protein